MVQSRPGWHPADSKTSKTPDAGGSADGGGSGGCGRRFVRPRCAQPSFVESVHGDLRRYDQEPIALPPFPCELCHF